jgi:hypothetical protein
MFELFTVGVDLQLLVAQATGVMFVTWFAVYFASYPLSKAFYGKTFSSLSAVQQYEWSSRYEQLSHLLLCVSRPELCIGGRKDQILVLTNLPGRFSPLLLVSALLIADA